MAHYQTKPAKALDKVDPVWARIRQEAEEITRREPELASFLYENILHRDSLETAVAHRVSQRLDHADVSSDLIRQAYREALDDQPSLGEAFRADIVATLDRDPATARFIEPVLYYKGFHAIQTHRLAHWLLARAARISRSICRAVRRRCSSATSIRPPRSAAASSSTTPPAWWWARRR